MIDPGNKDKDDEASDYSWGNKEFRPDADEEVDNED